MSVEEAPTMTLNVPGSTINLLFLSHNPRSWGVSTKVTFLVSPGFNEIRSKPRNSFI